MNRALSYIRSISKRRILTLLLGIVVLALGIAIFKKALLGNDPFTAFSFALEGVTGISFAVFNIIINGSFFIIQLLFGRKYIGFGTVINWFCVGVVTAAWIDVLTFLLPDSDALPYRLLLMVLGVIITALGVSMYQTPDLGAGPYDSASLIMAERLPIPYFWCRMMTDGFCALMTFLLGGLLGLGTVICAFGLGPFVSFFTTHFTRKLCGMEEPERS